MSGGSVGHLSVSPTLRAFLEGWQPRQRRTLGMLNALLVPLHATASVHPEWAGYDLLTHLLAALHLIIENDRLTGGHTEGQIVDELIPLVASERPADEAAIHRAIATAVVDVLTNARERRLRLRDLYLHVQGLAVEHREQSFAFVRAVGDESTPEPALRATPEAVNVFQNLYHFDPSDRAAAERYRSERMLTRHEYDEVLTSVERRATSVHGLRSELETLLRRIGHSVRDVDYATEVIPRLDDILDTVREQVAAEERFAEAVADLAHHAAPDLPRLERIGRGLRELIIALANLQSTGLATRLKFEAEQDRQLFTYRRVTINPQAQLLEPLLDAPPAAILDVLLEPLATWLGPRAPRVLHLGNVVARSIPTERVKARGEEDDPFELGDRRGEEESDSSRLLALVTAMLAELDRPTSLSELLVAAARVDGDGPAEQRLPWALAVTVVNAYAQADATRDHEGIPGAFDHQRLLVVAPGDRTLNEGRIRGDDPVVVPRRAKEAT